MDSLGHLPMLFSKTLKRISSGNFLEKVIYSPLYYYSLSCSSSVKLHLVFPPTKLISVYMKTNKHPMKVVEEKKNKLVGGISLYAYHIINLYKCQHHHLSYIEWQFGNHSRFLTSKSQHFDYSLNLLNQPIKYFQVYPFFLRT